MVKCSIEGCSFETTETDPGVIVALLNLHALSHTQPQKPSQPKLDRPRIDIGVEEEVWNGFQRRWEAFKTGSGIVETTAPMQLFQCASEALGDLMLKADHDIQSRSVEDVMKMMKGFAVIPIAIGVRRAELMQLQQSPDELFRTFAARVKGKAETCQFSMSTKCNCGMTVQADYTTETIRDVLLAGIADIDIRREALSNRDMQQRSVNEIISFVESREMARNATPHSSLSAISTFKREKSGASKTGQQSEVIKPVPCPQCGTKFHQFKMNASGKINKKPHSTCLSCWRSSRKKPPEVNASIVVSEDFVSQISVISVNDSVVEDHERSEVKIISGINENGSTSENTISLNHQILSKRDLKKARGPGHPRAEFSISLATPRRGSVQPEAVVRGVVDSGAMSNLWSLQEFLNCGFTKSDLVQVKTDIRAANKNPINIIGAMYVTLKGRSPSGKILKSDSRVFVSDNVSDFYLSFDSMLDLGIIDCNFPTIGSYVCNKKSDGPEPEKEEINAVRALHSGCTNVRTNVQKGENESECESCKCPQRESVPPRPTLLPFEPIPENNEKMKKWLLDRYSKSTFNTCPHRPLPSMSGPPIEIHIDENAKPKTCHTAAPIPLHWQEQVHRDLIRDEALGVIERVPYGEPVTWCHRMVVTRKHDGSPRRTVDLSPLNKHCKRETYSAEAPFLLARRIPGKTWKTVADAWNGFHSVPLRESDRHLTTFITPFGRWRYTRAPQGFLSSGDGYNRRVDAILSDFERKERCVDDTIYYDEDLAEHWWRTIDFLSTMGSSGNVLNPEKLQFAVREADFAGFAITESRILPLPKYIDAIQSFPTPASTTDIRSWFGLINRVANYAQLRDALELFRPFLSPKYKFFWSHVLEKAFQESKDVIVKAIERGVEIFDTNKLTCLRPDWSKKGIGYFLLQKHCNCTKEMPDCCPEGWKITLAGSRFLNGAEQRYAPVEGEALAIAWGLEQTRYFTQGCPNLLVVTDHKPLKKIFGDRTLDEISNTRLFRMKQRTLPWYFKIEHMPGKTNEAADAISRYPSALETERTLTDNEEGIIAAAINREMEIKTNISWEVLKEETLKDQKLSKLLRAIEENNTEGIENEVRNEYERYIEAFYASEGVVMYRDRVVVPPSLRMSIVENLHAAHQGVSTMERRAQAIVFWPGMSKEIQLVRARCNDCNTIAPSQAQLLSNPATPPKTPFEQVFADFFDFAGHHYLVVGDRLSGWPEIYSTPTGSSNAGAKGLIACLRSMFATFGVPEELSSDGGPEFIASQTKNFLQKWGVHHRKASAYHPQSNGRAEVAVKAAKRLLQSNINPSGSLDNDKFLKALLQLRNTPDPDCRISPAEIVFGRPIRDAFSFINRLEKFSNEAIKPTWREAWAAKESALRTRFVKTSEKLNEHAQKLEKLNVGDRCLVQNQTGNYPKRWERTGIIVEAGKYDQYTVKIDGSGRLTVRNRRFLRKFQPASMEIKPAPGLSTRGEKTMDVTSQGDDHQENNREDNEYPLSAENQEDEEKKINSDYKVPDLNDPIENHPLENITPPKVVNTQESQKSKENKIPTELKRLLTHNKEGLKEGIVPMEEGGRKTRSKNK